MTRYFIEILKSTIILGINLRYDRNRVPINPFTRSFIFHDLVAIRRKLMEDAWIIESEEARQSLNGRGSNASEITLRTFIACIAEGLNATAIHVPRIRRWTWRLDVIAILLFLLWWIFHRDPSIEFFFFLFSFFFHQSTITLFPRANIKLRLVQILPTDDNLLIPRRRRKWDRDESVFRATFFLFFPFTFGEPIYFTQYIMEKIFEDGNYQTPKKSWFEFEELFVVFQKRG